MQTKDAILAINPKYSAPEFNLDYRCATAKDYADKLDRLPQPQREAVALFHALHSLAPEQRQRRALRAAIDRTIAYWYPKAGAA